MTVGGLIFLIGCLATWAVIANERRHLARRERCYLAGVADGYSRATNPDGHLVVYSHPRRRDVLVIEEHPQ